MDIEIEQIEQGKQNISTLLDFFGEPEPEENVKNEMQYKPPKDICEVFAPLDIEGRYASYEDT